MEKKELERRKEVLLTFIESKRYWRQEKAEQYPDDLRNKRSAKNLIRLYNYIEKLSINSMVFERWVNMPGEEFDYLFGRYGFDSDQDPSQFVAELAQYPDLPDQTDSAIENKDNVNPQLN